MPIENLAATLILPIKRSLAEDVVDRLREAIYKGQLAPSERLREEVLASFLGLSRGPVREALAQLEREGLVIRHPNRSVTVARLSLDDLEEVYSLRLALEQLAVKKAIKNADSTYFEQMQTIVSEMQACLERGITTQEAAHLDLRFHELIYEASHHRRLLSAWSTLRPQIHVFLLSRNVANEDFRLYLVAGHQELLDVMMLRDETRALEMLHTHLMAAYERVLKSYSTWLEDSEKSKA
jgi:DNA-binding GntR family transcriptional regulator